MADGIPGLGSHQIFPSFARFRAVKEPYYVVCDPAVLRRGEQVDGFVGVSHPSLRSRLAALLSSSGSPETRVRGRILRVGPGDGVAFGLCQLVERLASTSAYADFLVDRERRVPAVLWRSVHTAFEVGRLDEEIAQARRFPDLAELVAVRVAQRNRAAAQVDQVQRTFDRALAAAQQLDARAAGLREEAALRERLATRPAVVDHLADVDAGTAIQVEAEALNELLAASDRLLRD
jgi:hypothetical protein